MSAKAQPERLLQMAAGLAAGSGPARLAGLSAVLNSSAPVQRVVIPQADIPGLAADFDTTQLGPATQVVEQLQAGGRRTSLQLLEQRIRLADQAENTANNKTLIAELNRLLTLGVGDVAESATSGLGEKMALAWRYTGADQVNDDVRAGVRTWVSGVPGTVVNWRMIGQHLRGLLPNQDYEGVGATAPETLTPLNPLQTNEERGRDAMAAASQRINLALAQLPAHEGPSYRQSGVANSTVYGGAIHVGDYIRDPSFVSTSALRMNGSAGDWGAPGTVQQPKAYFIIQGRTGRYISKAAQQEEGQHEVLFRNDTPFRVDRITNIRGTTFFVYVTEAQPPQGANVKNPYNGNDL
ncbi:hypothetical protein [Nitrospirillum iridis]|uniref:ADP ribosyltransferase domain-containing protein n=1 Tax=Nitrospirillum iridis TaxID=765888 RepID=A0A7X0EG42_9PROT|nr:hypothetical protein [Nitrospirillum iridis]MBB6253741.1 hypothetical protein [Nitrospirillum iridis]